jgi:hypothetical protein
MNMRPRTKTNDFRERLRRPPPDYTQRSVKLRIFIYLAAIMAVLSVIERSRNPQTWRWMWGRQWDATEKLDNRLRDSGHRTANDLAGTFVLAPDPSSDDDGFLAAIQDDTPIFRPAEREAWFHQLARVRNVDAQELEHSALRNVAYLQLHKQPADYRGKVVSVKGAVRQAYRTPAPENELGVQEYCVYVLQPVGQPDALIFVYALDAPPGFPRLGVDSGDLRGKMREDVEVTGIFFKRCAYAARGGTYTAPVLIANAPRWTPPPMAIQPSDRFTMLEIGGAVVAALLLAACIAAVMWKRTSRSHRLVGQQRSGGFVELGPLELAPSPHEKLRELERQARSEGSP